MFIICQNYLKEVLKNRVGITSVHLRPQKHNGGRHADVFTLPTRNTLSFTRDYQQGRVRKWRDPKDLDENDRPRIKERPIAAEQSVFFRIILTNSKADKVNEDFKEFIRSLDKYIYDGAKANYLDDQDQEQADNKGNVIAVLLRNYDFNDNRFYGALPSKVIIDVEFTGAIYKRDREVGTKDIPKEWVAPQAEIKT